MRPKLYKFDFSPPSRACMMVCDVLGLNETVEIVDVDFINGGHNTENFLKINPMHTVPVLEDGDIILHDSHAIMMYLADAYCEDTPLYPKDHKLRALVNQKLLFNNSVLFPNIRATIYNAVYDQVKTPHEKIRSNTFDAYGFLEEFLCRHEYLAGDYMTLADISASASMSMLVYIVPLENDKYPKTEAWMKAMESKPFYQKYSSEAHKAGYWIKSLLPRD